MTTSSGGPDWALGPLLRPEVWLHSYLAHFDPRDGGSMFSQNVCNSHPCSTLLMSQNRINMKYYTIGSCKSIAMIINEHMMGRWFVCISSQISIKFSIGEGGSNKSYKADVILVHISPTEPVLYISSKLDFTTAFKWLNQKLVRNNICRQMQKFYLEHI